MTGWTTSPAPPVVVPVGHLLGTHSAPGGPPARRIRVRRGAAMLDLDDEEFAIWWLAHGEPNRLDTPWTADALAEAASDLGFPPAPPLLDRLRAQGLVVDVRPSDAVEFARRHRLVPLMLGLGNTSDEPGTWWVGLFDRPVIPVPAPVYDVYRWAAVEDHLWNACRGAAEGARRAELTDPEEVDPEARLRLVLELLHPLLTTQAAAVDVRRGPPRSPGGAVS